MTDTRTRIIGVVVLAIGLGLAYVFAYLPLDEARQHAESINVSLKPVVLAPVFALFGVFTLAFGQRGRGWLQIETNGVRKMKPAGWLFTVVALGAGIGFHQWLEAALRALGYRL
jgi:hypothetical protein